MADQETSHIMWITIVTALAAMLLIIFKPALASITNDIMGNNSKINNIIAQTNLSENKATLNIDIARHPMTESELKTIVDVMPSSFTSIGLTLSDDEHLMYQSAYLGNTNSEALSIAELKDFVSYAKSKNIVVVPHLDSPSHAASILSALQTSHPDVYSKVKLDNETLDYSSHDSITLMETLYDEILPVFKGQAFNQFVLGADEVPGSATTLESLTTYINTLNAYINKSGFTTIIWNDSIMKSSLDNLDKNIIVWYWSQSGHATDYNVRVTERPTVSNFVSHGNAVVNANDYANTYHMTNLGNSGDENYFLNYLKNETTSKRYEEIIDGTKQWWSVNDEVKSTNMVITIWGENSESATAAQVANLVKQIELPNK